MTLVNDAWSEERARLESELVQARQLEAIGRLAAGIAHDCNNLLSAIEGYAQLALASLEPRDPVRADVEEISRAATRATALTRQLLAVGSYPDRDVERVELTALVRGVERLLRRMLGDERELLVEHVDGKLDVLADQGQLEQVLVNLALNARDATTRGSTIRIRTERATFEAGGEPDGAILPAGCYARLSVSDRGMGMAPEVLAHAFDLYFSTKGPHGGTGLGLPTANAIVARFGGAIALDSEANVGTVASVYLPLVDTLSAART